MGKIIIEIENKIRNAFKSKVAAKGLTIKKVLTDLIKQYSKTGGKQ